MFCKYSPFVLDAVAGEAHSRKIVKNNIEHIQLQAQDLRTPFLTGYG